MRRFYVHDSSGLVVGEGVRFVGKYEEETAFLRSRPSPEPLRLFMNTRHFEALLETLHLELFWLDGADVPAPGRTP